MKWVGPKKERQPLNIGRADGKLLFMAGLFNYWRPANSQGRPMLTFTIVTTAPSRWMARIHSRMPVILQDDQVETWLDPAITESQKLNELLKAPPENFLDYPVSRQINSVRFDDSDYAQRIDMDYLRLLQKES
jgi:putative SOS response-associated peptidase YedK